MLALNALALVAGSRWPVDRHNSQEFRALAFSALSVIARDFMKNLLCLLLILWLVVLGASRVDAQTTTDGYYYHVQPGDTWFSIGQATGYAVQTLQAMNPQAVRAYDLLYKEDKLLIPADYTHTGPRYHEVAAGDTWSSIAAAYAVTVHLLEAANPDAPPFLTVGVRLLVPVTAPAGTVIAPAPTPFPSDVIVPPAYRIPLETATETEAAAQMPELVPRADLPAPACPQHHSQRMQFMTEALVYWHYLAQGLVRSAENCGLIVDTLISDRDINGDGFMDLLLTYRPDPNQTSTRMDLALFLWAGEGMDLSLQAKAAGEVALLAVGDINRDERKDIVWTDKTCGTALCYTRVHIESWEAETRTWQAWTELPIAMVNADVRLVDAADLGHGLAVQIQGGEHTGADAGPQRTRTEIWASQEGQPFRMMAREHAPARYLYHVVWEAHEKTLQSPLQDLHTAQVLYRQALADNDLALWVNASEQDYLRAFSLFRLAIIASYQDAPGIAREIIGVLDSAYASSVFAYLGRAWLEVYEGLQDPVVACTAALAYAEANPATWRPFTAFGYANPGLAPIEVCPVLNPLFADGAVDLADGEQNVLSRPAPLPLFPSADQLRQMDPDTFSDSDELPPCPPTLDGYPNMIQSLLNGLQGDLLLVETWMRLCEVMTDDMGAIRMGDLNDDGFPDVVAIVGLPHEQGFGPDGMGGRLMVFYGGFAKDFHLIFEPATLGLPHLLAMEDINADGKTDLAWFDEVCNMVCLSTVDVLSWEGDHVNSFIRSDATITNGKVWLAPVPETNPGQGQQIILEGGISSLIAAGPQVSRVELWESIEGEPYRRVWLDYDPANPDSRCLGLNLVEAQALMEAAPVFGYSAALQHYQDILANPTLTACGLGNITAERELALLRGLTYFRLVQAHALAGDMRAAIQVHAQLGQELAESSFVAIAGEWRQAYAANADPVYACQIVLPLIQAEPATWQITDIFGVDHPAQSDTTLCFIPDAAT